MPSRDWKPVMSVIADLWPAWDANPEQIRAAQKAWAYYTDEVLIEAARRARTETDTFYPPIARITTLCNRVREERNVTRFDEHRNRRMAENAKAEQDREDCINTLEHTDRALIDAAKARVRKTMPNLRCDGDDFRAWSSMAVSLVVSEIEA